MQIPYIQEVVAEGLHNQFDFEIFLKPGLNILYGKNGRGKTTLLHLLANILELDFQRFSHLQFSKISLKTSEGNVVDLIKGEGIDAPKIYLNGNATSYSGTNSSLSEIETTSFRNALGPKPTYLPAFRSILERTKSSTAYYRSGEPKDSEMEELISRELVSLREIFPREKLVASQAYFSRQIQEEAHSVAEKTSLCRQWFGRFVPVIRYPSVADVEDALGEEWRRAAIEISVNEQTMFEETFVKIFRVISGAEDMPTVESNENLLASISELLPQEDLEDGRIDSKALFDRLTFAAKSIGPIHDSIPLRGVDRSLLELYRQVLYKRNAERRSAFQKSRDFEDSINRFLDQKTLKIGTTNIRSRLRNQVTVKTTGDHSYGLSALSSGERQILTMLYSASRSRFQSGVFLIDEPELSLHIDWQRIILEELRKQSPNRQLIACTHSPEVGADHMFEIQDFEPRATPKTQESLFSDEEI